MPAYKDSKTGTWFIKFYCKDWTGENKQIKKRGFATKREALDYERNYKIRQESNLDMTFGEFWKLYTEDVKNYVKLNTWLTKEHIMETKILPYFKNLKMNEITPGDVRKWQNEMVAFRYENGKSYSQTYKKTMHNILSAIFNHACRFYNLKSNPARQAGNMGREEKKEMLFWTTEEYKKFSEAVIDKPVSFYSFEMLYWTGMRLGELLALTMEDFDFEKNTVRINKSYQRLQGQDVITTPKTSKSNRTIKLPIIMSKTTFEKLGIPYEERDGIFYPVLVAGTEKADIDAGKYGRMWIKYIKEEYPMRYKSLVRFGELEERADEVNDTAYELLDDIEAKWLKKHKPKNPNSFTEQLQLRTQTRMMAEEIVIMDVVMQFH